MPTDILLQASNSPSGVSRPAPVPVRATGDVAVQKPAPEAQAEAQQQPVNREELTSALRQLSSHVQNVQRNLNFSIDEDSGRMVVKVIDAESEEVIRQIPPEEMLAVARRLRELSDERATGLLVQSKA